MKRTLALAIALLLIVTVVSRTSADVTKPADLNLIPWPAQLDQRAGEFTLTDKTLIITDPAFANEAAQLAAALSLKVGASGEGIILKKMPNLPDEGYTLDVTSAGVTVAATTPAGAFYGCQTLRQLVAGRSIPCVSIHDAPRIAWRGLMLDVSRHYFDKHELQTVLDQMAAIKLNTFHWHLTDDQGWRVPIKKYPRLTTIGAWRPVTKTEQNSPHIVDGQYGGFYTADDIREILAYAEARHIRVIPEIDMPGHMSAAAAAYPELSPANGWTPMVSRLEKGSGERCAALCVGREKTVEFCKDVLAEVIELFPSKDIHIGGDEVFYEQWKPCPDMNAFKEKHKCKDWPDVQVAFGNEMSAYLAAHGRRAIFWNNIYRQDADKQAINQFWRDMHHPRAFANAGYSVVLSPYMYYFDHAQKLEHAYSYDPFNIGVNPDAQPRLLGIEACAWSERIPTMDVLYQHIYPRLIAIAETGWTPQESKNWVLFQSRLEHFPVPGQGGRK